MENRKPKFYYTNQTVDHKWAREIELLMEADTGIELENPFHDGEKKEVAALNKDAAGALNGTTKIAVSYDEIVAMDLRKICNSDGLVAMMSSLFCVGSIMELVLAKYVWGKPVYVIDMLGARTPSLVRMAMKTCFDVNVDGYFSRHPWIKYFATEVFRSPAEFVEYANKKWGS